MAQPDAASWAKYSTIKPVVTAKDELLTEVAKILYQTITPVAYSGHVDEIAAAKRGVWQVASGKRVRAEDMVRSNPNAPTASREEAWKKYLGLSYDAGRILSAIHKPTKGTEATAEYFRLDPTSVYKSWSDFAPRKFGRGNDVGVRYVLSLLDSGKKHLVDDSADRALGVMGTYTIDRGEDERGPYISYYDKWDLDHPLAQLAASRGVGTPFELYDRIYYNPETLEPRWDVKPTAQSVLPELLRGLLQQ